MIVFPLLLFAGVVHSAPTEEFQLKFVTFVHRHGDRSPLGPYPNDFYGNESIWNNGWGQLTNKGKASSYQLGKWLRERYSTFLPKIYNSKDFEVQSTDMSRTLMSAYLVLAGMYEPSGSDVWHPNIKWQPIPVHATPQAYDNVLAASKSCPRHKQILDELIKTKDIQEQLNPNLLKEIVELAGYNATTNEIQNFYNAVKVCDSWYIQQRTGFTLPKWSDRYFPQPLMNKTVLFLRLPTYTRPLQRLNCGNLVKEILKNFKEKSKGILQTKMWQYSAHDITIVGLRQCLGFTETEIPVYSSALILELRSKGNEYFVRILYKNGEELKTLVMPGCVEDCPLKKFEELVVPVIPVDWEAECRPLK